MIKKDLDLHVILIRLNVHPYSVVVSSYFIFHPFLNFQTGSGDGIVEHSMRTSSTNSSVYSYPKSNPPPNHTPSSHSTYSHLRSRSGPPVIPQLIPLSAKFTMRPDSSSNSPIAVQRCTSRQESAPVASAEVSTAAVEGHLEESDPNDSLTQAIDDLAKITQELDDTELFIQCMFHTSHVIH